MNLSVLRLKKDGRKKTYNEGSKERKNRREEKRIDTCI